MSKDKSSAHNLKRLISSLQTRQQRARQVRDRVRAADELWRVWRDAVEFRAAAGELWSAGRDAALLLLDTHRRSEGLERFQQVLGTLCTMGLHSPAASCLDRIASELSDAELIDIVVEVNPTAATVQQLSPGLRARVSDGVRAAYSSEPTADKARVLGRLLSPEPRPSVEASIPPAANSENHDLEARALRFARSHGSESTAGIRFEALYALWRMLTEVDIVSIAMQDLEDVKIVHRLRDGSPVTEHLQAKKSDKDWSIPDLQGKGKDANKVFDSFAEVAIAEPSSLLTFATDAKLSRGLAPELVRAADKFKKVTADPMQLSSTMTDVSLSRKEREALEQLKANMRPDLLVRIDLPSLLGKLTFDASRTRRELLSEVINQISAILEVPTPSARDTYLTFVGLLLQGMEERKEYSRIDIDGLLRTASVRAHAFRDLTTAGARVEVIDFAQVGEASAELYYQGFSSSPADIAAGLDALRPDMMAEIRRVFADLRCCIIRAPSGQGKTTLMYRFAFEAQDEMVVLRVNEFDTLTASEIARLIEPIDKVPTLVLIDNIAAGDPNEWPNALRRVLESPQVMVLGTSREDDWRVASIATLSGIVDFVYPKLDEYSAEFIFEGLSSVPGLQLSADHWREPFEQSEGLLMEYVHLLTQGRHMRDLISEQISGLERRLGDSASLVLGALHLISTAHRFGGYLSRATLARLLPGSPPAGIGRALRVLEDEFWVRDSADGRYVGLHQVRSRVVSDVLHESDPITQTLRQLLGAADASELGAMLEELLYAGVLGREDWFDVLVERSLAEGPHFALAVAAAAYAAEERRHADAVLRVLERERRTGSRALLATWATMPKPIDVSAFISALPAPARANARLLVDSLPRRNFASRLEAMFLRAFGEERLAEWLARDATAADFADLLRLLAIVEPELGRAALATAGVDSIASRMQGLGVAEASDILAAVRETDASLAMAVAERLGADSALERSLESEVGIYAVRLDGTTVKAQFLAGQADEATRANHAAVEITRLLYGLFPAATACEVTGYLGAGTPHPDGQKQIPRENMPPPRYHIALNQFWDSIVTDRLSARSLIAVLRLHDNYADILLRAFQATFSYLDDSEPSTRESALGLWEQLEELSASIPYAPRRGDPLFSMLGGGPSAHSHSEPPPLDRAFGKVQAAAEVAGRDIVGYLAHGRHNQAVLGSQLLEVFGGAKAYSDLRQSPLSTLGDDGRWAVRLPAETERLYEAFKLWSVLPAVRGRRGNSRQLWEALIELMALVRDLQAEAKSAQGDEAHLSRTREKAAVLGNMLLELNSELTGFEPLARLQRLLEDAQTVTSGPDSVAEDERAGTEASEGTLFGGLESTSPLDVEISLISQDEAAQRQLQEAEVGKRLATAGVDAYCRIDPPSLSNGLLGSASVVTRVADLRTLEDLRATVREIAFGTLPENISRITLLLSHQDGMVLPVAFQTWRISDIISDPYLRLIGLGPWSPIPVLKVDANQFDLEVDLREHPVASATHAVRDQLVLLMSSFSQALAIIAAGTSGWHVNVRVLARKVSEVAECLQSLTRQVTSLGAASQDQPDWFPAVVLVVDAVGGYLSWLTDAIREGSPPERMEEVQRQMAEAVISCDNLLYLGSDRVLTAPSAEAAVARLESAINGFSELWMAFAEELSRALGG